MHRLRERWVALFGGALLVTLSVSVAFGADPADGTDGPRGQAVAEFVHSLIFNQDEPAVDEEVEAVVVLEEEAADTDAEVQVEAEVTGAEHGACVSEEASDKTDETEEDGNHGAVVSEAARVSCWEAEAVLTPEELTVDEVTLESEANAHGVCVSEEASDKTDETEEDGNHGAVVSEAARVTCWEE